MKRIIKKINNNIILFSIIIIFILSLFIIITTGFNGLLKKWDGLIIYSLIAFTKIFNYTYYGKEFIGEIFWILFLIPILIISKKTYIFTQKKERFFKSLLKAWPLLIFIIILLFQNIKSVNMSIDFFEVLALLLFTLAVGIFEELLCRGWILNGFLEKFENSRKNIILSILISSFIFGIIHILNFFAGQPLVFTIGQIIGAISMGIALGAIYYRTKNIWTVAFIHGFWDFAIFFGQINEGSTCITNTVENASILLTVFYLLNIILQELPGIGNAILLLEKDKLNECLPKEKQIVISKEEKKESHIFRKIITVILIVYLSLWAILSFFSETNESNTCPEYITKDVKEYSETIINKKNYTINIEKRIINDYCLNNDKKIEIDIQKNNTSNCLSETSEKYNYNFKINEDNMVEINNNYNSIILDYKNVTSLIVYENINNYIILISAYNDSNKTVIYYSNYLSKNNISNNIDYLNDLKNSFSQVLLPSINQIGYFEETNNNYKYPLFISEIEDRYILDENGIIYKYRTN